MLRNTFLAIFSQPFRIVPFFITPNKTIPSHAPLIAQIDGPRRPVIIDTDMSHDDMVAIVFLLQHPTIEVVGITIVNGVASVKNGLENARRLLAMVGREDIPVVAGSDKPLAGENAFPESWRRIVECGLRLRYPATAPKHNISAPALMRQVAANSLSPLQIIALGPLTNIAHAFQEDPALATRLDSIVIGGGAINLSPIQDAASPNQVAEWNLWVDPLASDIVFRSGAKLIVVPLDVTHTLGKNPLLISRRLVNELSAGSRWRETEFMLSVMKGLFMMEKRHVEAVPIWDLTIAAIAVEPHLGTEWQDLHLKITTGAPEIAGQTVVDKTGEANARVCLGGEQLAFETAFLKVPI